MTGEVLETQKESFWKEHQNTLVRLRHDLVSGKTNRSKFSSTTGNVSQKSTGVAVKGKSSRHPPFGKYRRTPSPYLPKLSSPTSHNIKNQLNPRKLDVVPPLKPKLAFSKPSEDYDSWGEETDDEAEDFVDDGNVKADSKPMMVQRSHRRPRQARIKQKYYKPQPYSHMTSSTHQPVVYAAPFHVYYPPPPKHKRHNRKHGAFRADNPVPKQTQTSLPARISVPGGRTSHHVTPMPARISVPGGGTSHHMTPTGSVMYSPTLSADEEMEDCEVDESAKSALLYWKQHPLFASDFTDWFIQDCCHTELLPDFLIEACNQMRHMPYDHPLYVPSLYCCEDLVADHLSELLVDVVRETVTEMAYDYTDEKMMQRDPLDDFLTSLTEDAVTIGVREIVRSAVFELAEDYLETQYATDIVHSLVDDYLEQIGSELMEDAIFDLISEEFIWSEVIAPEVKEEADVIARDTLQYYDNKVMRREFQQVNQLAETKLADVVMMELIFSVITQQGRLWVEDDYVNKYLDDVIFNENLAQMINVRKDKEKTLYCKPLHKLHEKVVSDVALDVFMQQLTKSLDEDLADVDEYERGVTDETVQPFTLTGR